MSCIVQLISSGLHPPLPMPSLQDHHYHYFRLPFQQFLSRSCVLYAWRSMCKLVLSELSLSRYLCCHHHCHLPSMPHAGRIFDTCLCSYAFAGFGWLTPIGVLPQQLGSSWQPTTEPQVWLVRLMKDASSRACSHPYICPSA